MLRPAVRGRDAKVTEATLRNYRDLTRWSGVDALAINITSAFDNEVAAGLDR